ncbi:MAG: hypothetical protein ACI8QZ_002020, partial [Chlamydiales bacterium]
GSALAALRFLRVSMNTRRQRALPDRILTASSPP